MLNEFQPEIIDWCENCGAALYDCRDWEKPRWEDADCHNGCLHQASNHKLDAEMDEIVDRINESTKTLNKMNKFDLNRLFKIVEDTETIKIGGTP